MNSFSDILIKDLMNQGFKTFFGLQGGASARLIESVIRLGGRFCPVLNEQAAGYAAHGYYLANNEPAGVIFTTGPGLTNGVSGIAACYFDRVPLAVIVGQVGKDLNVAKKTKTRMVGFQEVQHLEIIKPIIDSSFKIESLELYKKSREKIFCNNFNKKVFAFEFPDDIQREKLKFLPLVKKKPTKKKGISQKTVHLISKLIKNSKKPLFILGSGFAHSQDTKKSLEILKKYYCNLALTWGAQNLQKHKKLNSIGLFGNHSPGIANTFLKESDFIISMGASLLQHQTLKIKKNFAKNAKIIFINTSINECKRAKNQFGNRLNYLNLDCHDILEILEKNNYLKNIVVNKVKNSSFEHSNITPVNSLKILFSKIDVNKSVIFSDAGATLSWSYQAANLLKHCAPIFTSYNLHAMGYANCAGIGAALGNKKNVYVIIGDGSLPMNSQELAWASKYKIKLIVIDNEGYGIIRQTQRQFYSSNFIASDFRNNKAKMPLFSVSKILKSYDIKHKIIGSKKINQTTFDSLIKSKKSSSIIIKTDYSAEVQTDN
jgi:acetolactate synthase-1/2/3 large subunit